MTNTNDPVAFAPLEAVLNARYSCRGFLDRPLDKAVIEKALRAAQRTPSWCNTQPWQVYVTSPEATGRLREALAASGEADEGYDIPPPAEYAGVFRDRRRECGFQLYDSVGIAKGDRAGAAKQAAENFVFFGAPHVALVTTEAVLGAYGVLDCGAYVHAFMLAARSLGLGCIAQAALASRSAVFRRELGIPPHRQVLCGIAFGHEDTRARANGFRTSRAGLDAVVRWVDE